MAESAAVYSHNHIDHEFVDCGLYGCPATFLCVARGVTFFPHKMHFGSQTAAANDFFKQYFRHRVV